ncbi:MAG: hypothetical protein LBV21_07305 [Candidatus Adiutrix sp.]|jgi:hypothetical protein|nr:hypothetical protein [Candidatus Adiutrix sp.]
MSALNSNRKGYGRPAADRKLVKVRPGRLFRRLVEIPLFIWAAWETTALAAEIAEATPAAESAGLGPD